MRNYKVQFKRVHLIFLLIGIPILIPLLSYLAWKFSGDRPLKVLVYDMTVPVADYSEHKSLSWVLIHQKFVADHRINDPGKDYSGFHPLSRFSYRTIDFSRMTNEEIARSADSVDVVYYTDTYGVYANEWYRDKRDGAHSQKIYGGLNEKDVQLITRLQSSKKLFIAEFNFWASPTPAGIRQEAEKLLDLTWTGWVGRSYDSLDTLANPEIPIWARRLYQSQYGLAWNFHRPGILFVHENGRILVLESGSTLDEEVPWIYTSAYGQDRYDVPNEITYPYWFDVTSSGPSNRIVSQYKIYANPAGKKAMMDAGIPDVFPCVVENQEKNYYYFCGDFSDNPIYLQSARFMGIALYHKFFYDRYNWGNRTPFFWHFYRPMVTNILDIYFERRIFPHIRHSS
ncbi:MAG: hypothetical protein LWW85_00380 [Marinilabiliales bacterium]|nr:hypothetical protein [Marinilabiliales bacterium]